MSSLASNFRQLCQIQSGPFNCQAFQEYFLPLFKVSSDLCGLVVGYTVVHEHFRAMNDVEVEHVLFQDLQVEIRIHLLIFGRKCKSLLPFSSERHFQAITDCGCLKVGTVHRGSKRSDDLGRARW